MTSPQPVTLAEMIAILQPILRDADVRAKYVSEWRNRKNMNGWLRRANVVRAILETLQRLQDDMK